jgi:hypothetical protein
VEACASVDSRLTVASIWSSNTHGIGKPALLASTASATGRLLGMPGGLETSSDFFGLPEVLVGRAPEEQASTDASHGHRNGELCGHAEEAVFHGGWAGPLRQREAGRGVIERLDFFLDGLVELRIHPGPTAYAAGFVYWDIFELDGWRLLGHEGSLFSIHREV